MLQAKIISKGNIILEEIEVPKPQEGEVLFKITYVYRAPESLASALF